ncbi:hypothetical protein [Spirillospora sp. NBC_01491]|uniref:hypothetical protein n=1 Tax=Spirillospora sp. NBC_01491 TaxID=2976007 RepID=UPI002E2FD98A|nr:hypothetical protein [Spirillospora sp. NBC_01491]
MIACYASGGGLGHLTRLRAYLHTTGPHEGATPVTVLTPSPFAADPRVAGGWTVRRAPAGLDRAGLTRWTAATLAETAPRELIIDAFPAGLRGELTAGSVPPGTTVTHLARLLRWDAYSRLLPAAPPRLDRTLVLEPLAAEHAAYLRAASGSVTVLDDLTDPPPDAPDGAADAPDGGPGGWLIVHAGPDAEILELAAYAQDMAALEGVRPRLTLVAPRRPAGLPGGIAHLDRYPAWPLAARAERIVTAAGFNAVRQFAPWRDRHRMLPFPRSLDDQFRRAARARSLDGALSGARAEARASGAGDL